MWPAETGDTRTLPSQEPLPNATAHSNTNVHVGTLNSELQGRASLGPVLPCRGLGAWAGDNGFGGGQHIQNRPAFGRGLEPHAAYAVGDALGNVVEPGHESDGLWKTKTPLLHTLTTDDPWNAGSAVWPCAALSGNMWGPIVACTPGFNPCPNPLGTSILTPLILVSARGSLGAGAWALRRAHIAGFHALVLLGPSKAMRTGPQDKEAAEHTLYERVACPSPRPRSHPQRRAPG